MAQNNYAVTKFFTNKIQSTQPTFPDYLIAVADIFARFDGLPYDRAEIVHAFELITNRDAGIWRDPADFRDEYSAYGSALGIFFVEHSDGRWITRLTNAARQLLCSTEPDPVAFCRIQFCLYQYPSGMGVVYSSNGRPHRVQENFLDDTEREVRAGIRIVPLRVIVRALLAQIDTGVQADSATIDFRTLVHLFNSPLMFEGSQTHNAEILDLITRSTTLPIPANVDLVRFSRNFHILEHTGILKRTTSRNGLMLQLGRNQQTANWALSACRTIASLDHYFLNLNRCETGTNVRECIRQEILELRWGRYYDGANLPGNVLQSLIEHDISETPVPPGPIPAALMPEFPPLEIYEPTPARPRPLPLIGATAPTDPEQTRILREKANRDHARILDLVANRVRIQGLTPQTNVYVDMFVPEVPVILEVKSCNQTNMISQVRRGISQLYEYRYRLGRPATLCLVLQEEPTHANAWLTNYLATDRGILPIWTSGDLTLDGPPESRNGLPILFPG